MNADYEEYIKLLHELVPIDEDESEAVDAILGQMDKLWNRMSEHERHRAADVSSGLAHARPK